MVCFRRRAGLGHLRVGAQDFGRFGWIAGVVYCAGAALRLARFNTNIEVVDKRFFQGCESGGSGAGGRIPVACRATQKIPVDDYGVPRVAAFLTLYGRAGRGEQRPFLQLQGNQPAGSVPFFVILLIVLGSS